MKPKRRTRGVWITAGTIAVVFVAAGVLLAQDEIAPKYLPGSPVPSEAIQTSAGPSQKPASPARDVYLSFMALSKGNLSASDESTNRLIIYENLQRMDWAEYDTYCSAGKYEDAGMPLLHWLGQQTELSADELGGLIMGAKNHGIDGIYADMYATALSSALISCPLLFVQALSALTDPAYAKQVADLTIYGVAERPTEAKAAVDGVMKRETLSDAEFQWAIRLKNRCDDPNFIDNAPPRADGDFVLVTNYIPNIIIDLKYATEDNFTGKIIYGSAKAYLRYGTVTKLIKVQSDLNARGYGLAIWDAYRPVTAQFKLWENCPDPTYVANPNTGFSSHSKGNTVDVTLTDLKGNALEMPSGFDDFSALADRDYRDVSAKAAANAKLLESAMTAAGFSGYSGEWWHYSDTADYPVEKSFTP